MAEKKVSLIIRAKDAATAVVKKVATGISAIAAKIGSAFKLAGSAAAGANQVMEIAGKVVAALGRAYDLTVAKALELRAANDPARREIEALGKATDALGASIGDALIPFVRSFAQALTPVIKAVAEWIEKNREVVATETITGLTRIASTLVDKVTPAVKGVVLVWEGWRALIQETPNLIDAMAKSLNKSSGGGAASALQSALDTAKGALSSGIIPVLGDAAKGLQVLRDAFNGSEIGQTTKEMVRFGVASSSGVKAVEDLAQKVKSGLSDVAKKVAENVTAPIRKAVVAATDLGFGFGRITDAAVGAAAAFGTTWGPMLAVATTKAKEWAGAMTTAGANRDLLNITAPIRANIAALEAQNANLKLQDDILTQKEEKARASLESAGSFAKSTISSIGSALSSVVDDAISGTKSAAEIIGGFFTSIGRATIDTIINMGVEYVAEKLVETVVGAVARKAAITGYAAEAAAAAYAATAAIPIVGPFLAPEAAAAAYAGALLAGSAGLADGGLVTSGRGGVDDVPAMVMRGEYVIPAEQVRENVRSGRAPDDSGSARGGGSSGSGLALTLVNNTVIPTSHVEMERLLERAVAPAIERMFRNGKLKLRST